MALLFSWVGSKSRLMRWLSPRIPPHYRAVDVCAGSGAFILGKKPSKEEIYNDVDLRLYHTFRVLQNPVLRAQVLEYMQWEMFGRSWFHDAKSYLLSADWTKNPVELACNWLTMGNQCWSVVAAGLERSSSFRDFAVKRLDRWTRLEKYIVETAKRFKRVFIANLDWLDCITKYDSPSTFFFIDPPYLSHNFSYRPYFHQWKRADHVQLLEQLLRTRGMVFLCGSPSGLYNSYLSRWHRFSWDTNKDNGNNVAGKRMIQHFWTNYSL